MSQNKFYELSKLFDDDERIMAHIIVGYTDTNMLYADVYAELLNCEFDKWVEPLENSVIELIKSFGSKLVISDKSDFEMLSEKAWKLKPKRKLVTLFNFMEIEDV